MFNNMPTVDISFGYDAHMQSYANTMYYSSLQPHILTQDVSLHLTSNLGPSKHKSANWQST